MLLMPPGLLAPAAVGGGGASATGEAIRFAAGSTAKLIRYPTGVNYFADTFTFSCWVKKGHTSGTLHLRTAGRYESWRIFIDSNARLCIGYDDGEGSKGVMHDWYSANNRIVAGQWHHICVTLEPTGVWHAYIDGVDRISDNAWIGGTPTTWPIRFPSTGSMQIGAFSALSHDALIAEWHLIGGQVLGPAEFGVDDGGWKAKFFGGSFGASDTQLLFQDAAGIGDDSSGNGLDFSPVNSPSQETSDLPPSV